MLPAARSYLDMFDEEETLLSGVEHPAYGAIRVPDGRVLAWCEYGSPRGVPCMLIPDTGSSRLAPSWLLHDSALPSAVRLLAVDVPGTGQSDPIGLGGQEDPAADLARMVETLAVGRVALIGIGRGVDEAFALAVRHPELVTSVSAVALRISQQPPPRRLFRRNHRADTPVSGAAVAGWLRAAGHGADLRDADTWRAALERMESRTRAGLGDRWTEPDFRLAVAADAIEGSHDWAGIDHAHGVPQWVTEPESVGVPVRLWHGQQEHTSLSEVRAITGGRPGWTLSVVTSPSALMGCWPQILSTAAASFNMAAPV